MIEEFSWCFFLIQVGFMILMFPFITVMVLLFKRQPIKMDNLKISSLAFIIIISISVSFGKILSKKICEWL